MMIEQDTTLLGEVLPVVLAWMKAYGYRYLQTELEIYTDPPALPEIPVTSARIGATGMAITAREVFWGKTLVELATNLIGYDQETHDRLSGQIWAFWKALKHKFPERIEVPDRQSVGDPKAERAGGRPSYDDDVWAISQIKTGRDWRSVYAAWVTRPGVVKRDLSDAKETFRKNIRKKAGKNE